MVLFSGPARAADREVDKAPIDGQGITGVVTMDMNRAFTEGTLSADLRGLTDTPSWVRVERGTCGTKWPRFVVRSWVNHPQVTDGRWNLDVVLPDVSAPAFRSRSTTPTAPTRWCTTTA
jgi:hypothetical protein